MRSAIKEMCSVLVRQSTRQTQCFTFSNSQLKKKSEVHSKLMLSENVTNDYVKHYLVVVAVVVSNNNNLCIENHVLRR